MELQAKSPVRFFAGLPFAAIITIALFLLMKALISQEIKLGERGKDASIIINPTVEELNVRERVIKIERAKKVEPPPPRPEIEQQKAVEPVEAIATVTGAIPDFDAPKLNRGDVNFDVSDRDAQPIVRIDPIFPIRAEERGVSGECVMTFDVSPLGKPYNIKANCSSSLFVRDSTKAVQKWKYSPKIVNGKPVARRGVETTLTYNLTK